MMFNLVSRKSDNLMLVLRGLLFFFFQAEDGIRDVAVTGVQTCALPISGEGTSKRDTQAYAYQATSSFKFFERSVRQRNCLTAVARQRFNGSSYHPIRCTFLVTLSIAGQRPAGRWLT